MHQMRDRIRRATALLAGAAQLDWTTVRDEEVCELLEGIERAGRLVDAVRVQVAAEIAERSRFELGTEGLSARHGHRKPV